MTLQRLLCSGAILLSLGFVGGVRFASAEEYVWARTNWGASNINARYSSMTNGYGGYYVPRSAVGNNYEGQRITNPNGYIIPANAGYAQQPTYSSTFHQPRRRFWQH